MGSLALANFEYGAIAAACWVIGLFFLGFWRKTHDRFFVLFASAFFLLGLGRFAMSLLSETNETRPSVYIVRLLAYLVFLAAIVDKNRSS